MSADHLWRAGVGIALCFFCSVQNSVKHLLYAEFFLFYASNCLNCLGKFNQKTVWPFWRMGWWENGRGGWRNAYSFTCVILFWLTGCTVKRSAISLAWNNRNLIWWLGLKLSSRISWSKRAGQRGMGVGRGWDWKKQPRKRRTDREVWQVREAQAEKAGLDRPPLASKENRTIRVGKSQGLRWEQMGRAG